MRYVLGVIPVCDLNILLKCCTNRLPSQKRFHQWTPQIGGKARFSLGPRQKTECDLVQYACFFLDEVTEIVGGHVQFDSKQANGWQPMFELDTFLKILLQLLLKSSRGTLVGFCSRKKLTVVESIAVIQQQFKI